MGKVLLLLFFLNSALLYSVSFECTVKIPLGSQHEENQKPTEENQKPTKENSETRSDPQIMLLSSPRSGSTWLMYILNYITKKGIIFRDNDKLMFKRREATPSKPIYRYHIPKNISRDLIKNPDNKTRFICLVRNYKELFARNLVNKLDKNETFWQNIIQKIGYVYFHYIEVLYFFDAWGGPKHLIFYEDLMTKPRQEVAKLCKFLGVPLTTMESFFKNYTYHQSKCLDVYKKTTGSKMTLGGALSDRKDMNYHSKKFPKAELVQVDAKILHAAPVFYRTYLRRYITGKQISLNTKK